jgi:hypothetical protein
LLLLAILALSLLSLGGTLLSSLLALWLVAQHWDGQQHNGGEDDGVLHCFFGDFFEIGIFCAQMSGDLLGPKWLCKAF